jgi:hypothetical protein
MDGRDRLPLRSTSEDLGMSHAMVARSTGGTEQSVGYGQPVPSSPLRRSSNAVSLADTGLTATADRQCRSNEKKIASKICAKNL